jgi:hypothetical protein
MLILNKKVDKKKWNLHFMDSKYAKNIKKTLNISIKKADLLWNIYSKKIKKAQKKNED